MDLSKRSFYTPGVMSKKKHPNGFFMPCCFLKKTKKQEQDLEKAQEHMKIIQESGLTDEKEIEKLIQGWPQGYGYNSSDMFLRAFVTSGLISAIYILVIFNLIPRQLFNDGLYFIIGIFIAPKIAIILDILSAIS